MHSSPIPSSSAAGKRVKFAPGGDTAAGGDEDDLDGEGEGGRKGKGIMNEGYDSDSSAGSDGGYGIGGGRKGASDAKGARGGGGDDDDDDMFGGDDDEGKGKGKGKEKKNKEFLEMGDIEGQEFGKGEEGEDSEAEEEDYIPEDDLANDDDAPRTARNKEGMGDKLSYVPLSHAASIVLMERGQVVQYEGRTGRRSVLRRRFVHRQRPRPECSTRLLARWDLENRDEGSEGVEETHGGSRSSEGGEGDEG